jgi:hypothetical protein
MAREQARNVELFRAVKTSVFFGNLLSQQTVDAYDER